MLLVGPTGETLRFTKIKNSNNTKILKQNYVQYIYRFEEESSTEKSVDIADSDSSHAAVRRK